MIFGFVIKTVKYTEVTNNTASRNKAASPLFEERREVTAITSFRVAYNGYADKNENRAPKTKNGQ
jgi:hypothetical protein